VSEPTKDDTVAALDREIEVMTDTAKSDDLKTWALLVAMVGIFGLLATAWESGGNDWTKVACITLGFFMLGDAATLVTRRKARRPPIVTLFQPNPLPIGIPLQPPGYGFLAAVLVMFLLFASKSLLPRWVFYLGSVTLCLRILVLAFGALVQLLYAPLQTLSFTDPNTPKWWLKPAVFKGFVKGVRDGSQNKVRGFRLGSAFGGLLEPAAHLAVAGWAFAAVLPVKQGAPLSGFRFGFLAYAAVVVLSTIVRPAALKSLPSLIILRRDLLAGAISPSDAYIGLSLAQAGIEIAPQIVITKQRVAALSQAMLKGLASTPDALGQYKALTPEEKAKHPLSLQLRKLELLAAQAHADVRFQIALHPDVDPSLLGVAAQIDESLSPLREALTGANGTEFQITQQSPATDSGRAAAGGDPTGAAEG
jgi:hypothetical protein